MKSAWKKFILLLIVLCCILTSGCFKISIDTTVHENGSVTTKAKFLGAKIMKDKIEEMKNDLIKKGAEVKPVKDNNMSGFEATQNYPSVGALAQEGMNVFNKIEGKNKGIQEQKGWFFDAYSFDLYVEGSKDANKVDSEDDQMIKDMVSDNVSFDFALHLPYSADSNNADVVKNDNKSMEWDLATALMDGKDVSMQTQFRIWHEDHIIITIVAIALLAIALIIAVVLRFAVVKDETKKKHLTMGIAILAVLLVGSIGTSAYMLLKPIHFNESDMISTSSNTDKNENIIEKEEKKATEKQQPQQQSAPLAEVRTSMKEYGIQDDVLASSYGHSGAGSLSITQTPNGGKRMVVIDAKNHQAAYVELNSDVYNFISNSNQSVIPPVIFQITILNDKRDNDSKLGAWDGSDHTLGIYCLYKFDNEGNVIPGMLTSGAGIHPSHYQAYLNEQKNVDLANLILTEMQALHSDANRKGVKI